MPVLESRESLGWKGVEGNVQGHPGYVAVPAGVPTVVAEVDWEIGRKLDEIKRRLSTGSLKIASKLTAAVALALVPAVEILRLADEESAPAPEPSPDPSPVPVVAEADPEPVVAVEAPVVEPEPEPAPSEPAAAELPTEAPAAPAPAPVVESKPARRRGR
jgi:outer membrane biosynthesis protein TonB